jgi:hypothetical protein
LIDIKFCHDAPKTLLSLTVYQTVNNNLMCYEMWALRMHLIHGYTFSGFGGWFFRFVISFHSFVALLQVHTWLDICPSINEKTFLGGVSMQRQKMKKKTTPNKVL